MIERFSGGPVGLDTIAASIGEESQRLKMCTNRIYCKSDLSNVTKRKSCDELAYEHFGYPYSDERTNLIKDVISMKVEDFDFDLPVELIAQTPLPIGQASRLLVAGSKKQCV